MKLAGAVLAAVAATSLWISARAAPPPLSVAPDAGASAEAPDPQKLALAERYMADTHNDRLVQSLLQETLRRGMDGELRRMNAGVPTVPETIRSEILAAAMDASRDMAPRLHERMVRLLASEYSTAQLQALVDFYETPVGRSIAEKSLDLSVAARRVTNEMTPEFLADFKRRLCARDAECPTGRGSPPPG